MVKKITCLLMLTLFAAACQPSTATETPAPPTPAPVKTAEPTPTPLPVSTLDVDAADLDGLQISVWHAWFGAPAALFDLQVAEFNEQNPWGITVTASAYGNYYQLYNEVSTALETDARPDVVVSLSAELPAWDAAGALTDLTPYITDPDWGLEKSDLADFPSVMLAQEQTESAWLGMPAQRTARFLLYNRTWGQELGFDAPPATFDEFRAQACAANQSMRQDEIPDNDGKGGWIVDHDPLAVLAWMRAFGGGPLDAGEYRFLREENITAFQSLKELFDASCAWVSTENTPYEQFAQRSALFATASMEEFPELTGAFIRQDSADEWTAIPFPGTEGSRVVLYGTSYALFETGDAEQLAGWLFVRWMLAPENQARWVKSTGLLPLRISTLEMLSDYQAQHPQWAAAVAWLPQAEIQPQLASWRQVHPILGDGFEHIFRMNVQAGSVSATLAEMGRTVTEMTR